MNPDLSTRGIARLRAKRGSYLSSSTKDVCGFCGKPEPDSDHGYLGTHSWRPDTLRDAVGRLMEAAPHPTPLNDAWAAAWDALRRAYDSEEAPCTSLDGKHYWTDAPDDETGWHCTICGLTEYPGDPGVDVTAVSEPPFFPDEELLHPDPAVSISRRAKRFLSEPQP